MYPSEHTKKIADLVRNRSGFVFLTTLYEIRYHRWTEEAFTYDANGNLETHTLATGFVLTYGYDSMDRIVEIMGSEGERKSYTYDALGNVTSMTDGEGNITRYAYTLSGQLAKVTDALGNETEYRYDVCDRLIEIRQYGAEGILKEDTEVSGMDAKLLEAERQNGRNGCARSPVIPETCGDRSQKLSMHWDRRKPTPMIKKDSSLENWIRKGI